MNDLGKERQKQRVRSLVPIVFKEGGSPFGNEPFDEQTLEQLEVASRTHPVRHDRIRARKRYKIASDKAKSGIDQAIHDRRLRRLKALWDPDA